MQCGNNRWTLLSKRAIVVNEGESRDNKVLENVEIIVRIMRATGNQSVDETAPAFIEAVENIVMQRITIYTYVNVMVFSITLVQSYKDASPSSWKDIAVWITEQVSILKAAAYHRYHIDWIQEQSGGTGVLRLVRKKYQTFIDCATGGQGFMRRRQAVAAGAGMICIITTVAAVWYNW